MPAKGQPYKKKVKNGKSTAAKKNKSMNKKKPR